jgi:hypothetical protein
MDIFGKGVTRLGLLLATSLLAASPTWAANCHDERNGSGVPTGDAFWKPMQFIDGGVVSGYGRVIYAVGEVEAATISTDNGKQTLHYAAFDTFIKAKGIQAGALVVFHSPGGNVAGGFALGEAIRTNSLRTTVGQPQIPNASTPLTVLGSAAPAKGECDSSCSLAFLGGVRRTVPTGSLYGVHAAEQDAISPIEPQAENFYSGEATAAVTSAYLEKMGIDPSWLRVAEACAAGFDQIQYLTPTQLAKTKTTTTFTTAWALSDDNDAIVVEGNNPDSSDIPDNHDDLIFACTGTPRGVKMRIDYLPEAYNAGEQGAGVRAAPADFIKLVSGYSLSGAKANGVTNTQPNVVNIAQSDVAAPLSVADAHHVTTTITLTSPVANLLNGSDTVSFSFNKQSTPVGQVVGQVKFDLSAEGHQFINDYSAACQ